MNITPLAAESMGARSMSTFVETGDSRIIIDPWVSETGLRFGLKSHSVEVWHAEKLKSRIRLFLNTANVIIITNFEPATFLLLTPDVCRDRTIFLKNPNQNTSTDMRNETFLFIEKARATVSDIIFTDGKSMKLGNTKLAFSIPGEKEDEDSNKSALSVAIADREKSFVYVSGSAGILTSETAAFIQKSNPNCLYFDGPETIWREGEKEQIDLDTLFDDLMGQLVNTNLDVMIIDHHLLRDFAWRRKAQQLFKLAKAANVEVKTAAEYRGEENNLLEARRKLLFEMGDKYEKE